MNSFKFLLLTLALSFASSSVGAQNTVVTEATVLGAGSNIIYVQVPGSDLVQLVRGEQASLWLYGDNLANLAGVEVRQGERVADGVTAALGDIDRGRRLVEITVASDARAEGRLQLILKAQGGEEAPAPVRMTLAEPAGTGYTGRGSLK